jgi:hypothetical protein
VSRKAIVLASGFQDLTYEQYIAPTWPEIRVQNLQAGYSTWGYNCNFGGRGNVRGLPADRQYFQGAWIKATIQIGPLGSLYRSWLDGQAMPGDPLDVFGDPVLAAKGWCPPPGSGRGSPQLRVHRAWTTVTVPADAQRGQTISLILQATDDGSFRLTRYTRVTLRVRY